MAAACGRAAALPGCRAAHCPPPPPATRQDMTTLAYLNEPSVLWNLKARYQTDDIYTYTGSILIAVNPFAPMPHLYGLHMMEQYRGMVLGELSPHVYAIADESYRQMRKERKSQSILVRGRGAAWRRAAGLPAARRAGPQRGIWPLLLSVAALLHCMGRLQPAAALDSRTSALLVLLPICRWPPLAAACRSAASRARARRRRASC